jgi:hypothetical protein
MISTITTKVDSKLLVVQENTRLKYGPRRREGRGAGRRQPSLQSKQRNNLAGYKDTSQTQAGQVKRGDEISFP